MTDIIQDILRPFDVTPRVAGYPALTLSVARCLEDPDRLSSVTAELYLPAARQQGCKLACVERNLRTIVQHAWDVNPAQLRVLAGCPLFTAPTVSAFLAFLTREVARRLPPVQ